MDAKIPQIIHYCWFGGNPLPESAKQCIESWKKFCPGYEIKEWNESNYDIHNCPYVQEAYAAKKWAFVSDYARFDILYTYGGLYFDTDVELVRPIEDILEQGAYLGMEPGEEEEILVNPGIGMAAAPLHPIYKAILDGYQARHFLKEDGTFDFTTVVAFTTGYLQKYGLEERKSIQCVEGIWIYPEEYFCPVNYYTGEEKFTENTRSIHHYMASWVSEEEMASNRLKKSLRKRFGKTVGDKLHSVLSIPYKIKGKIRREGFFNAVRNFVRKRTKH